MESHVRIGNTELIRSFLIFGLAVMVLMTWVKSTIGGPAIADNAPFNWVAALLFGGFPLLIFALAAAVFRHYGRVSPFVTRAYARTLLAGTMVASIVAAAMPVVYMAHWIG